MRLALRTTTTYINTNGLELMKDATVLLIFKHRSINIQLIRYVQRKFLRLVSASQFLLKILQLLATGKILRSYVRRGIESTLTKTKQNYAKDRYIKTVVQRITKSADRRIKNVP